ncbi:MAG: phage integrase SAM-like domain-containing protein [Bacteroidia bacterium]|nr:phage integrase SAM-like domain-containing protein [Bacteroidia bacterium]
MITIRYKPLRNGEYSIYLDIYSIGKRERKFLGLRSSKDYSKTKFISKEDFDAVEKARKMVKELSGEIPEITNPDKNLNKKETAPSFIEFIQATKLSPSKSPLLIKHLQLFIEKKDISFNVITEKWIKNFETYLNKQLAESYVNELLLILRNLLNKAVKSGFLSTNPLSGYKYIKHSNDRPFLTNTEIEDLSITSIPNPLIRLAFFFSLHSGLTWEQVTTLTWEQIKVEKGKKKEKWTVTINGYLNHAVYTNELSDSAVEILKEIASIKVFLHKIRLSDKFQTDKNVYLNVNELSGNVFKHLPNKPNVNISLRLWGAMAGIKKDVCFSMARNTYAMKQVENGARKQQLKRLLNVSRAYNISIYERMGKKIAYDKPTV